VKPAKQVAFILVLILCASVLPLAILGCDNNVDMEKSQYVDGALSKLEGLLIDVGLLDPAAYLDGFESYAKGEFQDVQKLTSEIDEHYADYEVIVAEVMSLSEEAHKRGVLEDLRNLMAYVLLSADLMKSSLDLVKIGAEAGDNSSVQVVLDMSNNFQNTYRMFFIEEFNRIAEKYNLQEY
jgi:hypothetical protein